MAGQGQVLLRDLVSIPDAVHDGDFVLALSKGVGQKDTITSYVVTDALAGNFDKALGLIKSALETGSSRAAYLDGSFGSGKSHFMAVLHAILSGDADARGKKGLADVVIKHDAWLKGRKFLLVTYHLPDSQSLDSAILGGYVKHVTDEHPGKPLPAVYIDDDLIADARNDRSRMGDEQFVSQLPGADEEWGTATWDSASLDVALSEPPGGPERRRLIGDLLAGPYSRYVKAVRADQESYITMDEGLSVISKHAKDVRSYDAIALRCLTSSCSGSPGTSATPRRSAWRRRRSPSSSSPTSTSGPRRSSASCPGSATCGSSSARPPPATRVTSLFETLKYWDGRFEHIVLGNGNLPYIAHERLLKPKDEAARQALADAFSKSAAMAQRDWDILLDSQATRETARDSGSRTPFSPAFVHAMVDISSALQRERTALKLMQQLLVDDRDTLPVGQLMPLGAIFDVLAQGADRPFTDKLREEFETARRFYFTRVRPYLLGRNNVTEEQAATLPPAHKFRAEDLVVKTLLLAALVPNVSALNGLTATRLAALNHGSIRSMVPNQERALVTAVLKALNTEFGEVRLSGSEDDPRVELALIGIDTDGILRESRHVDNDAARRRLVRDLLWEELKITDDGAFETQASVTWRGTARTVEVLMENASDPDRMSVRRFAADPHCKNFGPWVDARSQVSPRPVTQGGAELARRLNQAATRTVRVITMITASARIMLARIQAVLFIG
ncbi:MAG: bacteriophage (phiC31) resistance pglY [Actinomycetia bacterium]|nr:bacteriophage (phiC31) resistance pglY [Actinomycetes bacterium]